VAKMQKLVDQKPALTEIPRAQLRALARSLSEYAGAHTRNEALALAFLSGQHMMAAIAQHVDVHCTTVSRLVKAYESAQI
jgi:putative transposase